jgi:hypothetical protein
LQPRRDRRDRIPGPPRTRRPLIRNRAIAPESPHYPLSVAHEVKMISRLLAPTNSATCARAASIALLSLDPRRKHSACRKLNFKRVALDPTKLDLTWDPTVFIPGVDLGAMLKEGLTMSLLRRPQLGRE